MTRVVDASVVISALVATDDRSTWAEEQCIGDELVAPHLLPAEVVGTRIRVRVPHAERRLVDSLIAGSWDPSDIGTVPILAVRCMRAACVLYLGRGEVAMAGASAARSARRMRERAGRLTRAAELWERGARGERRTAEALAALPANEWTVFHDVSWPGRPGANVDHVAVGPTGIFVIDSKHWSRSITVRDGIRRQNGYRRDNAIAGAAGAADAAAAADAIASLVPEVPRTEVHPVLAFVGDAPWPTSVGNVLVMSTSKIVEQLHMRDLVLPPEDRQRVAWELELRLHWDGPEPATPIRQSRALSPSVAKRSRRRNSESLVSPIVGGALVVGVLGAAFSHPQVFEQIGHVVVSLVGDNTEQPPADEPVDKPKKDEPKKDRSTD